MAGKNQVTLTFAGDSANLEQSFDKVGASAKTMADGVDKASKDMDDSFKRAGDGLDTTYNKFDGLESIGRGTTDTMSGLSAIMKGDVLQGSTDLAGGVAALAVGFSDALLPAIKGAVTGFKGAALAVKGFTLSLLTNPVFLLGTAIAALVVGLVVLYKKSETARTIMNTAFKSISSVVSFVVIGVLTYFKTLANAAFTVAEKVVSAFAAIPGPQQKALKAAAKQIRDWKGDVNGSFDKAINKVGELNRKIQNIPKAKKVTVTIEEILTRKTVGNFGGGMNARASGGPAMAGELYQVNERGGPEFFQPSGNGRIIPLGAGTPNGGAQSVNITLEISGDLVTPMRKQIQARTGGNVQLALGTR